MTRVEDGKDVASTSAVRRGYYIYKSHAGGQCWRRTNKLKWECRSIFCGDSYWLHLCVVCVQIC